MDRVHQEIHLSLILVQFQIAHEIEVVDCLRNVLSWYSKIVFLNTKVRRIMQKRKSNAFFLVEIPSSDTQSAQAVSTPTIILFGKHVIFLAIPTRSKHSVIHKSTNMESYHKLSNSQSRSFPDLFSFVYNFASINYL